MHDHEALVEASSFDRIIPLYIFDLHWFGKTSFGFPKTGRHRTRFLIESVQNLRENLQKLNADLIVRSGNPASLISELVEKWNVEALFAYGEPADEEQNIEDEVKQQLSIETHFFWGHSLFHLEDIPYETNKVPKTFTNFRKQVEKKSEVRECFPNPGKMNLPELEGVPDQHIHEPWMLTREEQDDLGLVIGEDYPEPMIDLEASYEEIRDRR